MNRYGETARRYWEEFMPDQYARIEDPQSWFAALGEYAALMIDELADELAGDDLPDEGYLGKVIRLAAARKRAEQVVVASLRPRQSHSPCDSDDDEDGDELAAIEPLVLFRGCPGYEPEGAY